MSLPQERACALALVHPAQNYSWKSLYLLNSYFNIALQKKKEKLYITISVCRAVAFLQYCCSAVVDNTLCLRAHTGFAQLNYSYF